MPVYKIVLVSEGTSDRVLCPILNWLFSRYAPNEVFEITCADLARLRVRTEGLTGKIDAALNNYPCAVICIHRDTDSSTMETRIEEIKSAFSSKSFQTPIPHIPVIPVRMTEAWLLFDEKAINTASGNPNNPISLDLPRITELESLRDPKERLHNALRVASGRSSRRLKSFSPHAAMHRIPDHLNDYSPLFSLPAFSALNSRVKEVIDHLIASRNS